MNAGWLLLLTVSRWKPDGVLFVHQDLTRIIDADAIVRLYYKLTRSRIANSEEGAGASIESIDTDEITISRE